MAPLRLLLLISLVSSWGALTRSPKDLIVKDSDTRTSPKSLKKGQVAEDTYFLIYSLERGYGGRKYVPSQDFDRVSDDLSNLPDQPDTSNPETLCRPAFLL